MLTVEAADSAAVEEATVAQVPGPVPPAALRASVVLAVEAEEVVVVHLVAVAGEGGSEP